MGEWETSRNLIREREKGDSRGDAFQWGRGGCKPTERASKQPVECRKGQTCNLQLENQGGPRGCARDWGPRHGTWQLTGGTIVAFPTA